MYYHSHVKNHKGLPENIIGLPTACWLIFTWSFSFTHTIMVIIECRAWTTMDTRLKRTTLLMWCPKYRAFIIQELTVTVPQVNSFTKFFYIILLYVMWHNRLLTDDSQHYSMQNTDVWPIPLHVNLKVVKIHCKQNIHSCCRNTSALANTLGFGTLLQRWRNKNAGGTLITVLRLFTKRK